MKTLRALLVLSVIAVAIPFASTVLLAAEKTICPVCHVKEGEAEPETVKATRTYEGKSYGFCSHACAKEFDADPIAYVPASLPRKAPAFHVRDLKGQPFGESLAGKVVLLDFWATWCKPCHKVMPELDALHSKYADRGFSVVGVSIDEGGPAKVEKFLAKNKVGYPIALDHDDDPAWLAFRVKAIPAAFLIDAEGKIVAQWLGAAASPEEIEAKVLELLPKAD